jgi:hypothetical protein
MLTYDTVLIAGMGTTAGKMLLGLRVLSIEHRRLDLQASFSRARSHLAGGLYLLLFFPLLQIFGAVDARRPEWTGFTKWDGASRSYVACREIGSLRKWSAYILSAILILSLAVGQRVAKEYTRDQIRDSFNLSRNTQQY